MNYVGMFPFLCFVAMVQLVTPQGDVLSRAVLNLVSGGPQVLLGEKIVMLCTVPGNVLKFEWFKDGALIKQISSYEDRYTLTATLPWQSGQYICQGVTDEPELQRTLPSMPLKIEVVAGWVAMQASLQPAFIGDDLTLTCHVRGNPVLEEVIFYKDGLELQRQPNSKLSLTNLTHGDQGAYRCKATWSWSLQTSSSESLELQVSVLDPLTQPLMTVLSSVPVLEGKALVLGCSTRLNVQQPGVQLRYYYYRDDRRLGVASQRDQYTIHQAQPHDSGLYQCKVSVGGLDLTRWSNTALVHVVSGEGKRRHTSLLSLHNTYRQVLHYPMNVSPCPTKY